MLAGRHGIAAAGQPDDGMLLWGIYLPQGAMEVQNKLLVLLPSYLVPVGDEATAVRPQKIGAGYAQMHLADVGTKYNNLGYYNSPAWNEALVQADMGCHAAVPPVHRLP